MRTKISWCIAAMFAAIATGCSKQSCPTDPGTGTIAIVVEGAMGAPVEIILTASDGSKRTVTASGTVTLPIGPVEIEAKRSRREGTIVGVVLEATHSAQSACVKDGATPSITVVYEKDPSTERLYVVGGSVYGLGATALASAGDIAPSATVTFATNPRHGAFAPDGSLFLTDAGRVIGYRPSQLVSSGNTAPAVVLEGVDAGGVSIPGPSSLAFDEEGALWVALAADSRIVRFAPADIASSGSPVASRSISGSSLNTPHKIAFDVDGNMWVASNGSARVLMYAHARLSSSITTAPDRVIEAQSPGPVVGTYTGPSTLAFDASGNLWVGYFDGNVIVRLTAAEQAMATVTPGVIVSLPVDVLLEDIAFDEGGALWFTSAVGRIGRLTTTELSASGTPSSPTRIVTGLAYASGLVFAPPSEDLPIAF